MKQLGRDVGFFLALALVTTWPLALHFSKSCPGAERWGEHPLFFETPVNAWNLWWFRQALVELHQSPFHTDLLFHPYGVNLWLHTLAPLHGLLALPLQMFLSLAATQNVILLLNIAASGVAAATLARRFSVPATGARLAGAIFAFSPYAFAHLYVGHMELLSTLWLPLGLWLFLRLIEAPAPRLRDGVSLGIAFVACAYVTQYYAVYLVELLGLVALCRLRSILRAAVLEALALAGAVAALGVTPIAVAFLSLEPGSLRPNPNDFDLLSGDLTGFLIPSFTHLLFGTWLRPLHERLNPGPLRLPQETTVFVGATVLFLAARGFRHWRKTGRPAMLLATIALVFGVLALGAHLKILGFATGLPLPAELLSRIPVLGLARAPGRHIVVATLALGVLAGAGYASLARARWRWLAIGLVTLEYVAVPLPLFSLDPSPVYARLAAASGNFAILDLPLEMRDGQNLMGQPNHRQMLGQTLHRRPVVGGMVSRLPGDTLRALTPAPVVRTLVDPVGATQAAAERDRREGPAWFQAQRIAALVVHPPLVGGPQERYLRWVLGPLDQQDFEDGTRLLWIQSSASAANR